MGNNVNNKLHIAGCRGDDVISFSTGMYRADQIANAFQGQLPDIAARACEVLKKYHKIDINPHFFQNGLECEVLSANSQGWKKGKVQIKFELEFIPEQGEEIHKDEIIQ